MVVVRVGEKGDIDLCEVDAKRLGVFPEGVARAGVKEDLVLFRFDVERKPVLCLLYTSARKATRYVTGHCTGDDAYAWLHETLGDRLAYMATGTTFTI